MFLRPFALMKRIASKQLVYDYKVTYENRPITSDIDLNFALLANEVGYEGNYEQFNHEGKMYYYTKIEQKGEED